MKILIERLDNNITTSFTKTDYERLYRYCQKNRIKPSRFMRELINDFLDKQENEEKESE